MNQEYLNHLDAPCRQAAKELMDLVRHHYQEASFTVAPAEDDPAITYILAGIALDDPEEVTEVTLAQELTLLEEGVAVVVIPLRTPDKGAALLRRMEQERRPHTLLSLSLP